MLSGYGAGIPLKKIENNARPPFSAIVRAAV